MKPPVTVLMSVYNGMPHLKEAVESILKQTFTDFDFLIFDDASIDGSSLLLAEYAKKDCRIKIVTNKQNYGLGYNLARGLQVAQTTWIARMDADDIAVPNRLEMQLKYINDNPEVDILGGYVTDINENGEIVSERRFPISNQEIHKLVWTCPIFHPTVMLRREAILKVGSYSPKLRKRQDYELWFRCVAANLKFANLTTPLIYYRFSDNTFKRNNWRVQLTHLSIGWRGCWLVGASPFAYLGVTKPLVISLLPPSLRYVAYRWLKKFDPRERLSN